MNRLIELIGGRKIVLTALIFIGSSILVYFTQLDQDSYFTLVKYLVLIYVGGNIAQAGLVSKKVEFVKDITETITQGLTIEQMGGRKFVFIIAVYAMTVILLLMKSIEASIYVDISNWIAFVYIGGNVTGKALQNGLAIDIKK